jgi:hypothetical protein
MLEGTFNENDDCYLEQLAEHTLEVFFNYKFAPKLAKLVLMVIKNLVYLHMLYHTPIEKRNQKEIDQAAGQLAFALAKLGPENTIQGYYNPN